jgi:UrcA family protein
MRSRPHFQGSLPAVALAIALATLGTGAVGAQDEELVYFPFTFELDQERLATQVGANAVYGQLLEQAREACRIRNPSSMLPMVDQSCAAGLVDRVVLRAGSPTLTARHEVARR